jgi:hypothetical protein
MRRETRETIEGWYRSGTIRQVDFEAYMFVWATSAKRYSAGSWGETPTDPRVMNIAVALCRHAEIPLPAALVALVA